MSYFYSKEELELMADKVNRKYFPERLEKLIPLDVYKLLEKLGLEVEWKFISPNLDIMGLIFFDDGEWPVWEEGVYKKGDKPHFEKFKKGTIVINDSLTDKKLRKNERFVCNHENSHWIKDQSYFKNQSNELTHSCFNIYFEQTSWNNSMSKIDIVERQTNYLNAAILMPRNIIVSEFFKRLRYRNIPNTPIKYKVYMKKVIKSLADDFDLNYNPILYRLYDLNILKRKDE